MAANDPRLVKLESIRVGAVGGGGAMGTTLTTINKIVPGSAVVVFEPGTDTDFYVEEAEYADVSITGKSVKRFEFATRKLTVANFYTAFGGSTTATIWNAPTTLATEIIKSVELTSKAYDSTKLRINIVRAKLACSGNFPFTDTDTGTIKFAGKILQPTTSVAPVNIHVITS